MFRSLTSVCTRSTQTSQLGLRSRQLHHKVVTRPQTIYALSTSPGKAGVAVVRISGSSAKEVLKKTPQQVQLYILIPAT